MGNNIFRPLTTYEERDAEWLVPGWIPKGCVGGFAADGGSGKTTIACHTLAGVSAGKPLFFESPDISREPMPVAFLAAEDSISTKLKRKLRLYGANMELVYTPDLMSDGGKLLQKLRYGSPEIASFVRSVKPAICIFDPLQSFLDPSLNMGSRNAMRNALAPLIALGEETGCVFLVVAHTNKRQRASGRDRIADSADFWDISRFMLMAGIDTETGLHYLSQEKSNYGELMRTRLFSIDKDGIIHGEGETWKRDREFQSDRENAASPSTREDCKQWILTQLEQNGNRMPTARLDQEAKDEGYSNATLRRAKDSLKSDNEISYHSTGNGKGGKTWYIERTIPTEPPF